MNADITNFEQDKNTQNNEEIDYQEKINYYFKDFEEKCTNNNAAVSVAIVLEKDSDHPLVYTNGHVYDVAKIIAKLLRHIKKEMNKDLSI